MEFDIKDEKLFNVANEWCTMKLLVMFSPERIIGYLFKRISPFR